MSRLAWQLVSGALLSTAAVSVILLRSWGFAGALAIIYVIWGVGLVAGQHRSNLRPAVRWAARGVLLIYGIAIAIGLLSMCERLYFVNGDSYPSWLSNADLGVMARNEFYQRLGRKCEGRGGEFSDKGNDVMVFRCGSVFWIGSETYIAHLRKDQK